MSRISVPLRPLLTRLLAALAVLSLAGGGALAEPLVAPRAAKAPAARPELGKKWIRLTHDAEREPTAMQTAIVRYTGNAGPDSRPATVDLIGAVHVGDADYYAALNERFRQYDALLYELVAPEGTVVPRGTKAGTRNPLGALQGGMKSLLDLEHQIECVDYTRPNFIHADMSPTEFFKTMEQRGESVLQMVMNVMMQSSGASLTKEQQEEAAKTNADLIVALFSKDRARRLKAVMARQFDQMEFLLTSFGGEGGSTIIHERNKKALRVLRQQLDAGKTRLGVFYGAGHLADMHERLVAEFGLQPQSVEWLTAWDLRPE